MPAEMLGLEADRAHRSVDEDKGNSTNEELR